MSELKLTADSGGGTVSLKGPATTTSNAAVPFVLPVADGSAGQYLKTDGSKNLSFGTVVTSIADDSITEAKLDIHAAPSGTDKFLGYTSNGMEWVTVSTDPTTTSGTNNFTVADGNLVIGTAGHGIDFSAQTATSASGASMSEEVLDHYEVGTWTPYWWGYHHSNAGWQAWPMDTAGSASGRYIRVGNVVHVWCKISGFEMDNTTSSYPSIAGLPFSGIAETAFGSAGYSDVFSNNSSEHSVTGKISDGTKIGWMCNSKSNPTINGSSNRTFVGGITYFVS